MDSRQTIRATDELRPDDELAEPVLDSSGNVLLPAGARLTEASIAGLERRGITQAAVRCEDPEALEAHREAVKARLEHLFRHAGNSEPARILFQAVLEYRSGEDT